MQIIKQQNDPNNWHKMCDALKCHSFISPVLKYMTIDFKIK